MKKIISILPENISGRLIISSLIEGLKSYGIEVFTVDRLLVKYEELHLNTDDYSFILGYDYSAIELKKKTRLNIPAISYFSDVIRTDKSGKQWEEYYKEIQKEQNITFYWDRILTERLKKNITNLHYLPLFVNTNVYKNLNLKPINDIMFAGRLTYRNRLETILSIIEKFPALKIALYCYPEHFVEAISELPKNKRERIKSFYKGFLVNDSAIAKEINRSKIILNFTSQPVSHLNHRVFEVLACEKFLLTDYRIELKELFTPGKDIVYYRNIEDLCKKIHNYLKNPESFKDIIKEGRLTIENKYTGRLAAKNILDIIGVN